MSRTVITLKLKMRWFPNVASFWAEKLYTDIDLAPLMPGKDKNFGVSLVLDFRTWWRHVQAKNRMFNEDFKKLNVNLNKNNDNCSTHIQTQNWSCPILRSINTWHEKKVVQLTKN